MRLLGNCGILADGACHRFGNVEMSSKLKVFCVVEEVVVTIIGVFLGWCLVEVDLT